MKHFPVERKEPLLFLGPFGAFRLTFPVEVGRRPPFKERPASVPPPEGRTSCFYPFLLSPFPFDGQEAVSFSPFDKVHSRRLQKRLHSFCPFFFASEVGCSSRPTVLPLRGAQAHLFFSPLVSCVTNALPSLRPYLAFPSSRGGVQFLPLKLS